MAKPKTDDRDREWLELAEKWLASPYRESFLRSPRWMRAYRLVKARVAEAA